MVAVIVGAAVATAVELAESGSRGTSGHRLSSHIAHLGASAILAHNAVVDGDINIATNSTSAIDAATIKFIDDGMVDFESDIAQNLVVTSASHHAELASVGVAMGIALIKT